MRKIYSFAPSPLCSFSFELSPIITRATVNVHCKYCVGIYIQVGRGESGISLEALIAISNRLGVTVDYLLSDYIENEDEYLRQLWVRLVKNRTEKEQDMIINVVKPL